MTLLRRPCMIYSTFMLVVLTLLTGLFSSITAHASTMQPGSMRTTSIVCQADCMTLPKAVKIEHEDDNQLPKPNKEITQRVQLTGVPAVKKIVPLFVYSFGTIRPPDLITLSVLRF